MVTVSDDFNRASLGAAWGIRAGAGAIVSNQFQDATDDGATGYYAVYETDVGSPDMYCRLTALSNPQVNASSNVGPAIRHRATVITGYQFATNFGTAQALWRTNAGSETNISNFTATVASSDVLQIEGVGRLIRAKVNSALVHLFQDTSGSVILDGQRGCINGYNNDNSDVVIADDFVAGPLSDLLAPYLVDWSAQTARSTGASMTPTIPVTPATGDLVVVHAVIRSTTETVSAPAGEGWSQVELASGNSLRAYLFAKLWGQGATDDTTPTFTRSGTTGAFVTAAIFRNPAHATTPWTSVASAIVASGQQSNAASATATAPSVSHTGNNRTLVRLFSSADDNALNAPNEGILVFGGAAYDATDIAQAMSIREDVTVTTSTGTATTTESVNGNDANNGITLVLAVPSGSAVTGIAALAGAGSLTASGIPGVLATAALAGTGSLASTGQRGTAGAAVLAGTGTLTSSGVRSTTGPAVLVGSGTLTANGTRGRTGAATLAGTGSLTVQGDRTVTGTAVISTGTLTASGIRATTGQASLTGTGALSASAATGRNGAAALTATGSLTAAGTRGTAGVASFVATASLTASGEASSPGEGLGTLQGTGTLAAAGVRDVSGLCVLTGTGSLTGAGSKTVTASGVLAGVGSLTATGVAEGVITGAGALIGGGLLSADGQKSIHGTAALVGGSVLVALGVRGLSGTGGLGGTGALTAVAAQKSAGIVRSTSSARPTVLYASATHRLVDMEVTTS